MSREDVRRIVREIFTKRKDDSTAPKRFDRLGGLSTEDVFEMIDHRDSFKNLYPGYPIYDDSEYNEDYYFRSKEEAYREVNELLDFFSSMEEPIAVYRTIRVKTIDDIDLNYLGDSWSYSRDGAINFAKNHAGGNVLLSATTTFSNVDWKETIRLHYKFSNSMDIYDEMELRIEDPSKLEDLKIEQFKKK